VAKRRKQGRAPSRQTFSKEELRLIQMNPKLLFCGIGEYQRVTSEKNLGKRFLKISLVERLKYDGPDIVRAVSHFVNVFVR
jgi:hypothetical protein